MWGSSAACYAEKPRLGGSGVKNDAENLIEINSQRGNFKIAPQNSQIPQNRVEFGNAVQEGVRKSWKVVQSRAKSWKVAKSRGKVIENG